MLSRASTAGCRKRTRFGVRIRRSEIVGEFAYTKSRPQRNATSARGRMMRAEIERGHQTTGESIGMQKFVFGNVPTAAAFAVFGGAAFLAYVMGSGSTGIALAVVVAWLGYMDFKRFQRGSPMLHTVGLTLIFTEEEKQIIKDNKLESLIIKEREPDVTQLSRATMVTNALEKFGVEADVSSLRVRHLLDQKKDVYRLPRVLDAKAYEAELADDVLPTLSSYLKGNIIYDGELGKRILDFP